MLSRIAAGVVVFAILGFSACRSGVLSDVEPEGGVMGSPVSACKCVGHYIVDSANCSAFYECDADGTPLAFGCPHRLQFNPLKNVCDFASNVDCDANGNRPTVALPDPCPKP